MKLVMASLVLLAGTTAGCTRPTTPTNVPGSAKVVPSATPQIHSTQPAAPNSSSDRASSREQCLREICTLIAKRLDLMPGVARAKWNRKLPITDPKREQALLDKMVAEGAALGLPAEFVSAFFQAQIAAAKLVQEHAFAEWKAQQHPPFSDAPDLERDIRPQIDELNRQLLRALKECWAKRTSGGWTDALERVKLEVFPPTESSRQVVEAAIQPLRKMVLKFR